MEPSGVSVKWIGPWFIYTLLVIAIIGWSVTWLVHISTKNTSRHCAVYVLVITLMILETLMFADILFDYRWEKDIPINSVTGFEGTRQFVEHNVKIYKWFGVGVVAMQAQAFTLLFSISMEQNAHSYLPLSEDLMDPEIFVDNSIIASNVHVDPTDNETLCENV